MGHGEAITDYGSRIAKLGTRPKGGSPEGNCELEKAKSKEQMTKARGGSWQRTAAGRGREIRGQRKARYNLIFCV